MYLEQRRQAMLQLHLSDQQFCLLKRALYYRLDGTFIHEFEMLKGLETSIVIGCFTSYKLSPLLPDTVSQPEGSLSAMWLSPMWWDLEWGLLDRFHPFWSFRHLSEIVIVWYIVWKYCLPVEYHVHIWQVSSQLSCGDTWQTCVGLEGSNKYFYKSKFPSQRASNAKSVLML